MNPDPCSALRRLGRCFKPVPKKTDARALRWTHNSQGSDGPLFDLTTIPPGTEDAARQIWAAFLWRGALRREGLLGRLRGEEFSVILPGADPELAGEIANRLRMLTEAQVTAGPIEAGLTISIGVALWNGGQYGMQDLLRRADDALYLAKKNGRNRVEMSAPECAA